MFFKTSLVVLVAVSCLASAAPAGDDDAHATPKLRLIKTSEKDPGRWVTEGEKAKLVQESKRINFVDITDIDDKDILSVLSTAPVDSKVEARQGSFPTTLSHTAQTRSFISNVTNAGPQSWLRSLTEYHNRHYLSNYGTQASTWLFNQVRSVASANPAVQVEQFRHSFNQPSIIARIPGESSDLVIVGAHYDSTAGSSSARAPGADDNGTGTVNVLEAFRILANSGFRPKNTLEFHFYGGEEGGLLGSQHLFRSYRSSGATVRAMLNQDMTGYSPGGRPTLFTDYVDSGLTAFVRLVAEEFAGATSSSRCGYGCSDHASARAAGFPAAFLASEPFATSNPNIHTSRDAYNTIQWDSVLRHSRLTVAFLVEASYL